MARETDPFIDHLMEMEFRLQQDLNVVQRRLGELLTEKEIELEGHVRSLRRAHLTVVPDPPEGA